MQTGTNKWNVKQTCSRNMASKLFIIITIASSLLCFNAGAGSQDRLAYSVFEWNEVPTAFEGYDAAIVWNSAAKSIFGDSFPAKYCKIELNVEGIVQVGKKLKDIGVNEGYSDERLIIFNTKKGNPNKVLVREILEFGQR